MGSEWRTANGFQEEDIFRCGQRAEVLLLEGNVPEMPVKSCSKCRKVRRPVVELRTSGVSSFMSPVPGTPGLERFRWDNCRTGCSSSRLHLGSRLVLAMHIGTCVVLSEPFELLSKKPVGTGSRRSGPAAGTTSPPDALAPPIPVVHLPAISGARAFPASIVQETPPVAPTASPTFSTAVSPGVVPSVSPFLPPVSSSSTTTTSASSSQQQDEQTAQRRRTDWLSTVLC